VLGRVPLTGRVLITEPIEDSIARLAARTSAISTGSPLLDRLLAGPGFLDAVTYPEISFCRPVEAQARGDGRRQEETNVRPYRPMAAGSGRRRDRAGGRRAGAGRSRGNPRRGLAGHPGPTPLVGLGYLGIIAGSILIAGC